MGYVGWERLFIHRSNTDSLIIEVNVSGCRFYSAHVALRESQHPYIHQYPNICWQQKERKGVVYNSKRGAHKCRTMGKS